MSVKRNHDEASLARRATADALSTMMLLVAAVVGSGIMGERLAGGNVGIALLANTDISQSCVKILKRKESRAGTPYALLLACGYSQL